MSLLGNLGYRVFGRITRMLLPQQRNVSHLVFEGLSEEEIICRFECVFNRTDLDGWDIRQAMNDLMAVDQVPDPRIIIAALGACRRINDYALTVRFLEACRDKCGNHKDTIYPYIIQEITPILCDLGCDLPETLGYDKPELWLEDVFRYKLKH